MFCIKCGNKLPEGSVFCDVCGNRVAEKTDAAEKMDDLEMYFGPEATENEPIKENKKKKKRKRKNPWRRVAVIILVLILVFNGAKGVVFLVDYSDYIFVNKDNCGMRNKEELIDKYIEAVLNGDDGEIFRLSVYPFAPKDGLEDYIDELTWTDSLKVLRILAVSFTSWGEYVSEQLDTDSFKTTYAFTETESIDIEDAVSYMTDMEFDDDDIEKAEQYEVKVTCSNSDGKKVVVNLTLMLVRVSKTWYVYNSEYWCE